MFVLSAFKICFQKVNLKHRFAVKHKNIGATAFYFHSLSNNFCKILKTRVLSVKKNYVTISFYLRL
jgi:hypothetical protein